VTPNSKFIVKKSKCVGLAQEIGFSSANFVQVALAGKTRNAVVHHHKGL
jgi:hypothetical protein